MAGLNLFAIFIPGFILEKQSYAMFPVPWHATFNYIYLIQTLLMMIYVLRTGRWVPSPWTHKTASGGYPWVLKQFWVMLVVHSLFYIVEMDVTSVFLIYFPMAIHHLIAIFIFAAIGFDPNTVSVVTLFPIVVHIIYWILGATSDNLLALYNFCLLIAGCIIFHNNSAVGVRAQAVGNMLPAAGVILTWVNYYIYCMYYHGTMCLKVSLFPSLDYTFRMWSVVYACLSFATLLFIAWNITRPYLVSRRLVPFFAKKEGFQIFVDATGGKIHLRTFEPTWMATLRRIPPSSDAASMFKAYFYALYLYAVFVLMDYIVGESSYLYKWTMPYIAPPSWQSDSVSAAKRGDQGAYGQVKGDVDDEEEVGNFVGMVRIQGSEHSRSHAGLESGDRMV
ncbi:hypothetical protein HDV05_005140 [Chytridiales sp. JEL 0842]|nr:hypothetical protein HDV05_005140 [Chytridiales sp. JEL 0842]